MSRDKPLWLGRGIKTATCQLLRFEDLHVLNQVVIWHSKAPKCWLQILSKWAVISHSDWGEASKLQYSRGAFFEDLHLPNQAAIWHPNAPKCWLQILSKWAVISHSDRGEASKLQHFKCSVLKTCICLIKLWYDSPKPQNADPRFSLNEPW